jgi:hypothetical protein
VVDKTQPDRQRRYRAKSKAALKAALDEAAALRSKVAEAEMELAALKERLALSEAGNANWLDIVASLDAKTSPAPNREKTTISMSSRQMLNYKRWRAEQSETLTNRELLKILILERIDQL